MVTDAPDVDTTPTLVDLHHIERAFRRAELLRRYSHGTFKRSAMAMINYYMRLASRLTKRVDDLHAVM